MQLKAKRIRFIFDLSASMCAFTLSLFPLALLESRCKLVEISIADSSRIRISQIETNTMDDLLDLLKPLS